MHTSKSISFTFFLLSFLMIIVLVLLPEVGEAQCRMCAASAESNLRNGGTEGAGLNTGILYLLLMPYIIVTTIGILYWRNRKKALEQAENELIQDLLS